MYMLLAKSIFVCLMPIKYLYCICIVLYFAGNVRSMMLHANTATLRGLTYFICGLYNVLPGNHIVQNSPRGEGGGL